MTTDNDGGSVTLTAADLIDDDDVTPGSELDAGLTQEERTALFEQLNALHAIHSPVARAKAWADLEPEAQEALAELGEQGPYHDEEDENWVPLGEGHPGLEARLKQAEQTIDAALPKVIDGTLWLDEETFEAVADGADRLNQLAGQVRDEELQRLARVLERARLHSVGSPRFGYVVQRESGIDQFGRHYEVETDQRGRKRKSVSSRADTERQLAEIRTADQEGRDPMTERSPEYVEAMAQLEKNELTISAFAKLAYKDRLAVLNAMTPEQTADFEAMVGTTGME